MWGLKQKSKLSIVVYLTIHVLAATLVFGCENRKSFYDVNKNNIDQAPLRMENPEDPVPDMKDEPIVVDLDKTSTSDDDSNELPPVPPAVEPAQEQPKKSEPIVQQKPRVPEQPVPQPTPKAPSAPVVGEASRFIKVAYWVVQNEAKKIGTPCNFYVSRVLELSGYSDDGFLANDFDIYARKHFSTYKDEKFVASNLQSERLRLKRYLWSYPSRTPFIIQWERPAPKPGHIAIVERIGDQLVIYQASLNRHIARREQTTIDRLLSESRAPRMTVYSEFVAR